MNSSLKKLLKLLSSLLMLPLALSYKITRSRSLFQAQGQLLSLIPGKTGSYLRMGYYGMTLSKCSGEGYIGFGSYFAHPEAEMGEGVYIGAYCILGMAMIGDHSTIGSNVHILSGKHQHEYKEVDKPIQEQRGYYEKISMGRNSWIGSCSVIMSNVGQQCIIGAGSVVVHETGDYEVIVGNPAKPVRNIISGKMEKIPVYNK